MTQIDWTQLEADRAAGKKGPWFIDRSFEIGPRSDHDDQSFGMILGCADAFGEKKEANARRIARVPDLEAYALRARRIEAAADELARVMNDPNQSDGKSGRYHYNWDRVDAAIAAYQAAKGDA